MTNTVNNIIEKQLQNGQEVIKDKKTLKKIKDRNNYKAFIYIFLISIGIPLKKIWDDLSGCLNESLSSTELNLSNLCYITQKKLKKGNNIAHDSSKFNIFKALFPEYNGEYSLIFIDEIFNGIKNIINEKSKKGKIKGLGKMILKKTELIEESFK